MRLIDANELMEHVWRDRVDSREAIAKMVENAPTISDCITLNNFIENEIKGRSKPDFIKLCQTATEDDAK